MTLLACLHEYGVLTLAISSSKLANEMQCHTTKLKKTTILTSLMRGKKAKFKLEKRGNKLPDMTLPKQTFGDSGIETNESDLDRIPTTVIAEQVKSALV